MVGGSGYHSILASLSLCSAGSISVSLTPLSSPWCWKSSRMDLIKIRPCPLCVYDAFLYFYNFNWHLLGVHGTDSHNIFMQAHDDVLWAHCGLSYKLLMGGSLALWLTVSLTYTLRFVSPSSLHSGPLDPVFMELWRQFQDRVRLTGDSLPPTVIPNHQPQPVKTTKCHIDKKQDQSRPKDFFGQSRWGPWVFL